MMAVVRVGVSAEELAVTALDGGLHLAIEHATAQLVGYAAERPLKLGAAKLQGSAAPDEARNAQNKTVLAASPLHLVDASAQLEPHRPRRYALRVSLPPDAVLPPTFHGDHLHIEYVLVVVLRLLRLGPLPARSPFFRVRFPVQLRAGIGRGGVPSAMPVPVGLESRLVENGAESAANEPRLGDWLEDPGFRADDAHDIADVGDDAAADDEEVSARASASRSVQVQLDGAALASVHFASSAYFMGDDVHGSISFAPAAVRTCLRLRVTLDLSETVRAGVEERRSRREVAHSEYFAACADSGGSLTWCSFSLALPANSPMPLSHAPLLKGARVSLEWAVRFAITLADGSSTELVQPVAVIGARYGDCGGKSRSRCSALAPNLDTFTLLLDRDRLALAPI